MTRSRTVAQALLDRPALTESDLARLLAVASPCLELDLWLDALRLAGLVRHADGGALMPSGRLQDHGLAASVDADLVEAVLMGLVRAVLERAFDADAEEERPLVPRGIAATMAVVGACAPEEFFLLGQDSEPDDTEETTRGVVRMFVAKLLHTDRASDERDHAECERLTDEVMAPLEVLVGLGVLEPRPLHDSPGTYLAAPRALQQRVVRTVVDVTGCTGRADDVLDRHPVEPT